ncbi:hypothetical protein Sjap_002674 [Stephania japonica]|uniref:Uncharacterized protein n=1 Tax=Stephania japonica TaxID=461633 RepID=A0AAP0KP23_9MAGN
MHLAKGTRGKRVPRNPLLLDYLWHTAKNPTAPTLPLESTREESKSKEESESNDDNRFDNTSSSLFEEIIHVANACVCGITGNAGESNDEVEDIVLGEREFEPLECGKGDGATVGGGNDKDKEKELEPSEGAKRDEATGAVQVANAEVNEGTTTTFAPPEIKAVVKSQSLDTQNQELGSGSQPTQLSITTATTSEMNVPTIYSINSI